jgi:predicted unusual protein kinase regulating ubiquinone biosynthesis (AarF/ABC1/UbiB family)
MTILACGPPRDPKEPMASNERPPAAVPTSPFRRGLRLTRMGVLSTARAAAHAVNNALRSDEGRAERDQTLWRDQALLWVREVGELKGSLMKAGQMLAMYGEHVLPKEAVDILRALQSDAPPVSFDSVYQVISQELPQDVLSEIAIDPVPCGSASLGQVHPAVLPDGQKVAIKVQYPGIKEALDSDLRALRRLFGLMRIVARGDTVDALFAEVRSVLHDELDYERERRMTAWYHDAVGDDARYGVPSVYPHLCGPRVLTTRFEEGVAPDGPEVAALSQARRNQLGLNVFEFYLKELFVFGRVQTDPHFGNFRVRLSTEPNTPDRLIMLDFGAVREVTPTYLKTYRQMMLGCLYDDRQRILDMGLELGLLRPGDSVAAQRAFFDLCRLVAEPFSSPNTPGRDHTLFTAEGAYDFGRSDLPKRVITAARTFGREVGLRSAPPECLFLDRKLAGVFLFMAQLRVVANGEALLRQYLGDADGSDQA